MTGQADDHEDIRQLGARYNWAIDFGDIDAWVDCFTVPDSVKQFWGGDCADILMEDLHGIDEVMDVLAPIIQAADD